MKKHHYCIFLLLLVCMAIYMFYRTDKTVISQVFLSFIPANTYEGLKKTVAQRIPLHDCIVYSLPEGLWVFCVTVTSAGFYVELAKMQVKLFFVPLMFAVVLELLQLIHFTNGQFDVCDIVISTLFWLAALRLIKTSGCGQNIFRKPDFARFFCISTYAIVYLAHVWQ